MDYISRVQRISDQLQTEKVNWLIVQNLTNIRYLSGFSGSHAVLLISPEKKIIVSDGRYQEQIKQEVVGFETVMEGERHDIDVLTEILGGAQHVWIEGEHCSVERFNKIDERLPGTTLEAKKYLIEAMRITKDKDEIAVIKKALALAENALQQVFPQITEGMTERKLANILEHEMWKLGAEKESFETLVQFGPRTSLPHGKPSDATLKPGQNILMDFGCILNGYCSDITRMAYFGEPSDEMKTIHNLVKQANENAANHIREHMTTIQADEFARSVIQEGGYGDQFFHGLGHGLGIDIHEDPRLTYRSDETLKAGNVVTIEPGIYIEGTGGVRLEDTAVITEDGCEILNQSSKEMLIL